MTKYFITGGTGFVGRHLLQRIPPESNEIFCLTRHENQNFSEKDSIQWIEGDLLDSGSYKEALEDTDYIFHLAGVISARRREDYLKMNVEGTKSLLKACKEVRTPIKRFVHMSSIAAQGPNYEGQLLKETDSCSPLTEYGKSKYEAEQVVLSYSKFFPTVILRPSFIYGRGDMRGLKYLKSLNNPASFLWTSHIKTICLCHVIDVIQSCLLTTRKNIDSGEVFVISDSEDHTWESIWDTLGQVFASLLGNDILQDQDQRHLLSVWSSKFNVPSSHVSQFQFWACDVSKAKQVLGFSPMMLLKKGAYDTILWYMSQGLFSQQDINHILKGTIGK